MPAIRSVCVFCGASSGRDAAYADAARAVGDTLARRGIRLVYGGGRLGLMGAVADAALAAGGEVVGVIPRGLVDRELAHPGVTELVVVETLHERKAGMAARADAFVALPGGLGTLEELAEVLSWAQLDLHEKPIGVLDVAGYFGRLEAFLDHAVGEGFIAERHRRLLLRATSVDELLAAFAAWTPPAGRFPTPPPTEPSGAADALGVVALDGPGVGVGHGVGGVPGVVNSCAATARIFGMFGIWIEPYWLRPGRTSGALITTRVMPPLPISSATAASEGRRSIGMSVVTKSPRLARRLGTRQTSDPPFSSLLRRATRTSCWRSARLKSLSPVAYRERA